MLPTMLFLVAFAFVAEGHMHINGVPVAGSHLGPHRRLFVPIDPNFCNAQAQQTPISCLQSNAGGTPYCSSFLQIPTITVCTTSTAPVAAGTTTITSILGGSVVGFQSSRVVKRAEFIQGTARVENDSIRHVKRHIIIPRQVAGCIPATQSAPYSSSVCSCLNIPTPTTTTTFTYTPPPTATQIVVVTPSISQSYTTISSVYTGTTTATSTISPAVPGQPGTVIVYSPQSYTTTTSYYTGTTSSTSTIAGQPATVVVYSPQQYTTSTSFYTGSTTATSTFAPATAGQTGTVIVYSPQQYTTSTSYYTGSTTATSTFAPATAGQTGTVIVYSPQQYTTSTSYYTGSTTATSTFAPATAGQPATVIVYSPQQYTTSTSYYTGSTSATSTFAPATPGQAATVIVYSPQQYTTSTSYYTGSTTATSTFAPATPGQAATVVVYSPQTYTTTTSYYTGSTTATSTFAPATAGQAGTVVVYNPQAYTTVTSLYTGSSITTTTQSPASPGGTGTVLVQQPRQYTTITTTGSVSAATTVTQFTPTSPGQTGTVLVQVPPLNTITTTVAAAAFTSTSTTTVNNAPSQVVVVGVPTQGFHIYLTDAAQNPIGYLDVGTATGTAYTVVNNPSFADSGLFYINNQTLFLSPANGVSAQPLAGVQQTPGGPYLFVPNQNAVGNTAINVSYWPDGSLRVANSANGNYIANLCNGVVTINAGTVAGCTQIVLNPTYDAINYTTTTVTSGTVATTRTAGPNGYTVSQGGTVTAVAPVPSCTATGIAYTGYGNTYIGSSYTDPDYMTFNASFYNGLPASAATFSGVTNNINFVLPSGNGPLYGTTTRNINPGTIVYRGFFSPPTTGTYTLSLTYFDDVAYVFMGAPVTAGTWGQTNYIQRASYFRGNPTAPISQTFNAQQLYPIVIILGNSAGDGGLTFSITTPAGLVLTDTTGYFYQPSCSPGALQIATNQPAAPSCAPSGVQFLDRPAPTTSTGLFGALATTTFNPDNYNPATAVPYSTQNFKGYVNNIALGVPTPGNAALVYGEGPYDTTQSAIFLRGYFIANVTGSYTFSLSQPDDVGYMWLGQTAISTWTQANANIRAATVAGAAGTYTTTLTAGVLTPIRLAFANYAGGMSYTLGLRDPNGVTTTTTWGFFQQPWCGGVAQYSNWT